MKRRIAIVFTVVSLAFAVMAPIASAVWHHKDYSPRYGYCGPRVVGDVHWRDGGIRTECLVWYDDGGDNIWYIWWEFDFR